MISEGNELHKAYTSSVGGMIDEKSQEPIQ